MTIHQYIPCPACHDIGGRGWIEEWRLGLTTYYVCEECELAWRTLNEVAWQNGQIIDELVKADGRTLPDKRLTRRKIQLFSISDESLRLYIDEVRLHGELIGRLIRGLEYKQLEYSTTIGMLGQRFLVVGFLTDHVIAFPSFSSVSDDFHW